MQLTPDEKSFLKEIEADLDDDSSRLIYADWLEERGDVRGEYLRLEYELTSGGGTTEELAKVVARINVLNQEIDPAWLALVSRSAIEGCYTHYLATKNCIGRWRGLQKTDEPTIRHCKECQHAVYFCTKLAEAQSLVGHLNCRVAVEATLERQRGDVKSYPVYPRGFESIDSDGFREAIPDELIKRLGKATQLVESVFGNQSNRGREFWRRFWNREDT